jgi:chitodextrinase
LQHRLKLERLFATLLLCGISLGPTILAVGTAPRLEIRGPLLQAPPYLIAYSGIGPTTISLNWTKSAGSLFGEYVLLSSTDGSSWATFTNISDKTNTSIYISGLTPGATNWWQIIVYDPLSHPSNPLKTTQPSTASLSDTQPSATSAQLKWTNNAAYGGFISFTSYQLMESLNGNTFVPVAKIIDESSLGTTVDSLVPSTGYSFYLNTTDHCNGCGALSSATTESNTVHMNTPGPLRALALTSPISVDVGQLVYFSCSGAGGASPYSYSWTFGDGSSVTGASPSHTYSTLGMMNISCTVTDSFGTIAKSKPISLSVYSDPSIRSFTSTPASLDLGQRIIFLVSTNGGNGSLTFSYSNLPSGCTSTNSSSFSCTPASSGTYDVRVTVTDQGQETANSTLRLSIAPPRVFGLPQTMVSALIFSAILGICVVVILSVVLTLRGKNGSQIRSRQESKSN